MVVYGDPSTNPLAGATARVHAVRTGSGKTTVTLHITELNPELAGSTFGAHVHTGPCGTEGIHAGPHYAHPPASPDQSLEDREVWLDFTVNSGGRAHAEATRSFTIPAVAARSVVLHASPTAPNGNAGPRLACIDVGL